jgi:hypothetical protein
MANIFNQKLIITFCLFIPAAYCDSLTTVGNVNSTIILKANLFKDTITNKYQFTTEDNKINQLNYLGSNYKKYLDTSSYEFKRISCYEKTQFLSEAGALGFGICMIGAIIFSDIRKQGSNWISTDLVAGLNSNTIAIPIALGYTAIAFGGIHICFKYIGKGILNNIIEHKQED